MSSHTNSTWGGRFSAGPAEAVAADEPNAPQGRAPRAGTGAAAGAAAVMPLAAPIGSNRGLATRDFIQILIEEIDLPIIVDAGIGRPSQACEAMEMGAAAIMANTALATAGDLPLMAQAFRQAIEAGRKAYLAGLGRVLSRGAAASDPLTGFLRD